MDMHIDTGLATTHNPPSYTHPSSQLDLSADMMDVEPEECPPRQAAATAPHLLPSPDTSSSIQTPLTRAHNPPVLSHHQPATRPTVQHNKLHQQQQPNNQHPSSQLSCAAAPGSLRAPASTVSPSQAVPAVDAPTSNFPSPAPLHLQHDPSSPQTSNDLPGVAGVDHQDPRPSTQVNPLSALTSSDLSVCPQLKLHEFFVQWLLKADTSSWIHSVLEDARSGKVPAQPAAASAGNHVGSSTATIVTAVSATAAASTAAHAAVAAPAVTPGSSISGFGAHSPGSSSPVPPGSPVSRLIHANLPISSSPRVLRPIPITEAEAWSPSEGSLLNNQYSGQIPSQSQNHAVAQAAAVAALGAKIPARSQGDKAIAGTAHESPIASANVQASEGPVSEPMLPGTVSSALPHNLHSANGQSSDDVTDIRAGHSAVIAAVAMDDIDIGSSISSNVFQKDMYPADRQDPMLSSADTGHQWVETSNSSFAEIPDVSLPAPATQSTGAAVTNSVIPEKSMDQRSDVVDLENLNQLSSQPVWTSEKQVSPEGEMPFHGVLETSRMSDGKLADDEIHIGTARDASESVSLEGSSTFSSHAEARDIDVYGLSCLKKPPASSSLPPRPDSPVGKGIGDTPMVDPKAARRKTLPQFYFPNGKNAEEREARELKAIKTLFSRPHDENMDVTGLSSSEIADAVVQVIGLPRFFAPIIFNRVVELCASNRCADEVSSASKSRSSGAEVKNMYDGRNDADNASTVSAAPLRADDDVTDEMNSKDHAGSSELFQFSRRTGSETVNDSRGMARSVTENSDCDRIPSLNEQSMRATAAHVPSAEQDMVMCTSNDNSNTEFSAANVTSSGVAEDTGKDPMGNDSTNMMAVDSELNGTLSTITESQFRMYYLSECKSRSREARLFHVLRGPNIERDYLLPVDFKPLMNALLQCHQGLAFLQVTPEFQLRYSETVIERIYFTCSRTHNGRLFLSDIRRSRLLDTLMLVDEEEDINRERRYFSYEHFYVLYCRFWELDTDHDLQIDREDLMRYGGHSLTYRIVDRIFGGYARPLNNAENPGYMSYADFIWFCLSEEDKNSETAVDYWYRCVDMDGDGVITMYDMEFFYKEQLHRMECFGHEPVQVRDILCQLLDMVKPNARPPHVRRSDLKSCRLAGNFFNVLFNLNKFFALEARDPLQIRQEQATPELTDWDRFAALEYLRLSAEEEDAEEESWEEVGEATNPLIVGEAPF